MRVRLLVALGAALLAAPAAAQSTDFDAALSLATATASESAEATTTESVRMDAAPRPLPMHLVPSAAMAAEVELDAGIVSHRPWWRIPLYGAALGLGVGLLAPNCSEGGDHTVCIPPEAIGMVVGGVTGLVVEGLMQSWVDHRPSDSGPDDLEIKTR